MKKENTAAFSIPLFILKEPVICTIVKRENRFTVTVQIDNHQYTAWINNTGRLQELLREGTTGFCIQNNHPGKTDFRLFSIRQNDHAAMIIDTRMQMKAFEYCIQQNLLPSPFQRCTILKRNAPLVHSRIDYLLNCNGINRFVEVKSAVLKQGDYAMYPDCPTIRGQKHLKHLIHHVKNGGCASVMFIAALDNIEAFTPYEKGDSEIVALLHQAKKQGVQLHAMQIFYDIHQKTIVLSNNDLPVLLR